MLRALIPGAMSSAWRNASVTIVNVGLRIRAPVARILAQAGHAHVACGRSLARVDYLDCGDQRALTGDLLPDSCTPIKTTRVDSRRSFQQLAVRSVDMKIGFLGLGKMGSGIASNLIRAGHEVTVWNRSAPWPWHRAP